MVIKRVASFLLSAVLLLTNSACAAAEKSPENSVASLTVSSALEESSPVESQTAAFSESGAFTDVTPGNWFYEAVEYCRGNGLMAGKGSGRFSPNDNMTRAELATVLYRHAKSPTVTVSPDFTDVKEDTWYTRAVAWAQESNIVSGYGNGRFGTNDPVRREDIAVIFWRYAGRPEVGKDAEFADMSKVSGYALEAVDWARANGIVSGKGNNRFDPKGCATRAEVATILMNFSKPEAPEPTPAPEPLPYDGIFPQHKPMGTGVGVMPGRVVWAHDPTTVDWDGSGYWWELSHFDEPAIQKLVDESIARLGGKSTAKDGWQALFTYKSKGGYRVGEKIAIKANINGSAVMDDDTSGRTAMSYTNPVLLKALLTSLVKDAGVSPADITVYDVSRLFPDYMVELCTQGDLQGVNFVGRNNGVADESAPIIWSQEFSGRVNYLPTCVTEAKYVINLANLKGHSYGITLCGKNHFGSFINGNAMRPPEGANLHQWLTRTEMGIYSPLTDLMANADLGGKTVLYMLDALICAPGEGASITKENATWQQEPFDGGFTASVFVSQDPVAIDSVGADFLSNEPTVTGYNRVAASANNENYLHESGLVGSAPSGTTYTDSREHTITNLGVHEHWNNSTEKKYSRNLGKNEGIELVQILKCWEGLCHNKSKRNSKLNVNRFADCSGENL